MDKTYQLGMENKSYLISPWTTEEITNQKTCFEIDGPVKPQSVLPSNLSAFEVYPLHSSLKISLSRYKK